MANQEHLEILTKGVAEWNSWREANPGIRPDLVEADFVEADLSGADLGEANLSGADLREANLSGADLSGADLSEADLSGADLSEANLSRANLNGASLIEANLSGANLSGADLGGADLGGASFRGADLRGANLLEADLSGADLSEANLSRANLNGASLIEADLSGADLSGADLSEADLSLADLSGANLRGVYLRDARIVSLVHVNRKTRVSGAEIPQSLAHFFKGGVGFTKLKIIPDLESDVSTDKAESTDDLQSQVETVASRIAEIGDRLTRMEKQSHPPDLSDKLSEVEKQLLSVTGPARQVPTLIDAINAVSEKLEAIESSLPPTERIEKLAGDLESLPDEVKALPAALEQVRRDIKASQEKAENDLRGFRDEQYKEQKDKFAAWEKDVKKTKQSIKAAIAHADSVMRWDKIIAELQTQAYFWTKAAVGVTVLLVLGALWVLWAVPEVTPRALTPEEWLKSLRPAILVAIPASVLIYLIRTCVRLALSAFHLRRDIDERRMLTNLYLSLIKDADVGAEAREIVLQALFTRSDTGLLHKDSAGSTMPGQMAAMFSPGGKDR